GATRQSCFSIFTPAAVRGTPLAVYRGPPPFAPIAKGQFEPGMSREIQPLTESDLPELSKFLIGGFHAEPDADFAAPDVLRWKYLEMARSTGESVREANGPAPGDRGTDFHAGPNPPLSYIARIESGPIIGHIGLCRTAFEGLAINTDDPQVNTIH